MNNIKLTCPQYISNTAYFSLVWIFQCMYVSVYYKYYLLTAMLTGLTGTSICYWGDCTNTTARQVDMIFATTTLGVKSYIAITDFATTYKYIWFVSLFISTLSYFVNDKYVEYKIFATYSNLYISNDRLSSRQQYTSIINHPPDIIRMYYISTAIHMFFIHFLPTVTFSLCIIMTNR